MNHDMTIAVVQRLMKSFTYKPNFEFEVIPRGDYDYSACTIKVTMWTLNSCQTYPAARQMLGLSAQTLHGVGGCMVTFPTMDDQIGYGTITVNMEPVKVGAMVPVPMHLTEDRFWDWLRRYAIATVEQHETDEWFKVNGVALYDPHSKGGNRNEQR